MNEIIWEKYGEGGPIIAAAIHDGHQLRREVKDLTALSDADRLREEDPFTGELTKLGNTQIIGTRSRFQVDLNRPREKAVYRQPEDAWGMNLWKSGLTEDLVSRSLAEYDLFYREMQHLLGKIQQQYGHFVVFDLHSYNYLREGAGRKPADPEENPEVNIGTGTVEMSKWEPLVNRFINDLSSYNYNSRSLDVRENVKFKGGNFSRWIHQTFPQSACSLSIELKKFFMDEWTGKPDRQQIEEIYLALQSTIPGVLDELNKL